MSNINEPYKRPPARRAGDSPGTSCMVAIPGTLLLIVRLVAVAAFRKLFS